MRTITSNLKAFSLRPRGASFFEDSLNCFKKLTEPQRKLMIRLVVNKVIVYSKDKIKIILSLPLPTNNKLISLSAKKGTAEPDACGAHNTTVPIFALSGVANGARTHNPQSHSLML